jgi:hypothetical protein
MTNDLDDLDGARGDPQPAKGRELVIVDLGHLVVIAADRPGRRRAPRHPGPACGERRFTGAERPGEKDASGS